MTYKTKNKGLAIALHILGYPVVGRIGGFVIFKSKGAQIYADVESYLDFRFCFSHKQVARADYYLF